ncbi:putative Short-chain dehydrogenase/reductase-like protein [Seiridium cardinale]
MSLYAAAHANPQGPGDARPTATQIVRDAGLEGKLTGKVIVITGATSGIGFETARALSTTGATLFLTVRDIKKAKAILGELLERGQTLLIEMDNTSLASVRTAAAIILAKSNGQVNELINNAGIMGITDLRLTEDGHEIHFATHHISHFLLFQLLKTALIASSTSEFPSRVVNVTSSAHRVCPLPESENYDFQKGGYTFLLAYARSKLATVYMANEIERRYGHKGLHATSVQPGGVRTNITRHIGSEVIEKMLGEEKLGLLLKSPEQGAATTVIAAVGKEWANKGGRYLEDCREAERGEDDHDALGIGYVQHTYDPVNESRLWKDSLRMVGVDDDM